MLKDIYPGLNGSAGTYISTTDGTNVYFVAHDGVHGNEIWKTDGTTQGTQLLVETIVGPGQMTIYDLYYSNNQLFVVAASPGQRHEIFVFQPNGNP